jgi:hypothetical protein
MVPNHREMSILLINLIGYGGERGIRTLSHGLFRLAMPPNALKIRELKNRLGIRGHQKAWRWSHGGPTRDIYMTDNSTHQELVLLKKERASSTVAVTPWVNPPYDFLGTIARSVYDDNIHK